MARKLVVEIVGDSRSFERSLKNSSNAARGFNKDITRTAKLNQSLRGSFAGLGTNKGALLFGSGAFVGTATLSAGLKTAVTAASDLNEQISKSREIFGESSSAIEDWSKDTARSFGISQVAALTATGTFGNLFRAVGLTPKLAGDMSQALVQLTADLASFNNSSPEDVLVAIRAGLIGEAEPLRRFGVLLSEARVQQEAMAATGKTNAKSLTDQEKALARYQIILRDTAPAQGDFARTSGSLANQSRVLKANLSDLAANIGGVLVPTLSDAAEMANLLFVALNKFRGIDFSPGFEFPDPPDWLRAFALAPVSPLGAAALAIKRALEDSAEEIDRATRPDDVAGPRGPGGVAAENVRLAIEERQKQLKELKRQLERSRKQFGAFTKGLGLKLDKAGLTASLDDDIAALRELEAAILRQIKREGRTFALVDQLTQVRLRLTSTIAERAAEQERKSQSTLKRVVQRQRSQQDARQRAQFEALGLTAAGEQRIPGVSALRKQLGTLREQVKGSFLDTSKTQSQLARIAKVLSGAFGKVGREVRSAIQQMLADISSALGGTGTGPQTKAKKVNINALLANVGLSEDEIRELRARLSQITSTGGGAGRAFAPAPFGTGAAVGAATGGGITINGDMHFHGVQNVAQLEAELQRRTRRRGGSRGGVRPGGRTGLG